MTLLTRSSLLPTASTFFNDFLEDVRFPSLDLGNGFRNVPSANIIETEKAFNIELAAPGMQKSDFEVTVDNGQLTIFSEKKDEKEEKGETYTRHEFSYNTFSRSFLLPDWVDSDKIKAKYEEGILKLSIPKKPEAVKLHKKAIEIG